ncbi:serine/threonine-protein kinase [Actinacidiphila paucisporea]|nr:serine/threonine-protein kinase [Actinacidiphila paucisporea]
MSTDPGRGQGEADKARNPHQRLLLADRYRLDALIGRGGMGQVWRGWDETLGRPVAVKVLTEKTPDQAATQRFSLEARTAAHLNDPHVVTVYDFGADQDRLYLVMELVTGRSLAQELEDVAALDAPRVAALGAQIAAGLATAHRHGIVHRDIKPANLLLDEDGNVSIADFGIARFTQDTTAALVPTSNGKVIGTVAYLSPERTLGRPATTASDVYALGCALYQLLTGAPPFTADVPAAILYQHVHTEPEPPHQRNPAIPPALSQYILRLLAKDPAERPTAEQAESWLRHWSPGPAPGTTTTRTTRRPLPGPAPALDPTTPSRAYPPRSKRRQRLVIGTAAAATLGATAAGILALSDPTSGNGRGPAPSQPAAASPHSMSSPTAARPAASTAASPGHASAKATTTAPPPPAAGPAATTHQAAPPAHDDGSSGKKPRKPKKPKK